MKSVLFYEGFQACSGLKSASHDGATPLMRSVSWLVWKGRNYMLRKEFAGRNVWGDKEGNRRLFTHEIRLYETQWIKAKYSDKNTARIETCR